MPFNTAGGAASVTLTKTDAYKKGGWRVGWMDHSTAIAHRGIYLWIFIYRYLYLDV